MESYSRILIVRACAIGDFVLNLPALQALAGRYAGVRFTLVGYPAILESAKAFIPVDAIFSIESPPWNRLFNEPLPPSVIPSFDAAYVWMKDRSFAGNLERSGMHPVVHSQPFPAFGHAADHILRTIGLPAPELPDLWKPVSPKVIIHPGSGSNSKVWPYFEALAGRVPGATVLVGPCESQVLKDMPRLTDLSLLQVTDELRGCSAFIGNDSGITHLAAYLGCPTVALFGPTDPRVWGPVGRRVKVLWKSSLAEISVDEVIDLI